MHFFISLLWPASLFTTLDDEENARFHEKLSVCGWEEDDRSDREASK